MRGKETSQKERDGRRRSHHREFTRNNAISAVSVHRRKTPGHSRPGDEVECICGKFLIPVSPVARGSTS